MDAFISKGVVPLMIDAVPPLHLSVRYGDIQLQPGQNLTPTQVRNKPIVTYGAESDALYTLVFLDADVPSRTNHELSEINHWMVSNIPGNRITSGEEVYEYVGSGPGQGSGLHMYVFLLYKQQGRIDYGLKVKSTEFEPRKSWKIRDFAKHHQLEDPVAGNFFQAEYDEWVVNIHRQIGML